MECLESLSIMPNPVKIVDIINQRRNCETLDCECCAGQGELEIFDPKTGKDFVECEACMGSGYNLLGLILHDTINSERFSKPMADNASEADTLNPASRQVGK